MSFCLPSQTHMTVYGPPAEVVFQPLNIGLSNFEVDPAGNSVSHATHTFNGSAVLVPLLQLLCPACCLSYK